MSWSRYRSIPGGVGNGVSTSRRSSPRRLDDVAAWAWLRRPWCAARRRLAQTGLCRRRRGGLNVAGAFAVRRPAQICRPSGGAGRRRRDDGSDGAGLRPRAAQGRRDGSAPADRRACGLVESRRTRLVNKGDGLTVSRGPGRGGRPAGLAWGPAAHRGGHGEGHRYAPRGASRTSTRPTGSSSRPSRWTPTSPKRDPIDALPWTGLLPFPFTDLPRSETALKTTLRRRGEPGGAPPVAHPGVVRAPRGGLQEQGQGQDHGGVRRPRRPGDRPRQPPGA